MILREAGYQFWTNVKAPIQNLFEVLSQFTTLDAWKIICSLSFSRLLQFLFPLVALSHIHTRGFQFQMSNLLIYEEDGNFVSAGGAVVQLWIGTFTSIMGGSLFLALGSDGHLVFPCCRR